MEQALSGGRPILIVDDDTALCALLRDYLEGEGFAVRAVHAGPEGLRAAMEDAPALVLLDVMLPGMDGFEIMRALRRESTVPIIMLTARGEEVDRIVGLEMGADDYLPKPFNPRELVARIKAVLRRNQPANTTAANPTAAETTPPDVLRANGDARRYLEQGALRLDQEGHAATLEGRMLDLTQLEFALLRELMRAPGRVLSRETLLDRVRGREFELFDRSIDVHVSHLRQKLGDSPSQPRFIKTVRSVGYLFLEHGGPGRQPEGEA